MITSKTETNTAPFSFSRKLKAVLALTKAKLNLSVVYSAVAGYLLGMEQFDLGVLLLISIGGFLVVGSANGLNQCLERDRDALMDRTKNRPLPSGELSMVEAMLASTLMGVVGLYALFLINPLTASFGAFALMLYVLLYTPLKAVGSIAVFVGALPGALPALLGWIAARNDFDIEPGLLFALQFIWQFAHFWAIAWMIDADYKKAGYSLLPMGKKDARAARLIVLYSIFVVPISILPYWNITGDLHLSIYGMLLIALLGVWFVYKAVQFYQKRDDAFARKLMLASVIYLPLVQLIYVLDKYMM